ncbi:M50 family metallopeptidase [Brachybacterium sp. p3-SID1565]|uniref:M50 family metallopeptidase n=1 Tax=Brachybacterium sp. p3-SID1565 TaxID=2916046 RepID=UPI0021A8DB79|nr:M50 family metallopeptidase [Brachybacterium sp. p3-SID1565]MCT1386543.1 M50 family metallopeptidase [Brachybacterium sp. p3-SID1565]
MKSPSLRLGSLPPIRISGGTLATLLILAVVIHPVIALSAVVGPGGAIALSLGISLFMIVSVLVHELAHALTARLFGATVDHIALTLWGGHTQYRAERMGGLPSTVISLAGPLSNLGLAALCTGIASLVRAETGPSPASLFWENSAWLNVALAVFNLLPGLPMDGGRALEALLGTVLRSRIIGTRITAWVGRAIAVAVVAWPLWNLSRSTSVSTGSMLTLVWALLIAGMLWHGASRALEAANLEHRIQNLDAARLASPVVLVAGALPLSRLPEVLDAGQEAAGASLDPSAVMVLEDGPPPRALQIDPSALRSVPPDQRRHVPVSAVAAPLGTVGELRAGMTGSQVVTAMLARPHPLYLVREADGTVIGVIRSAEVNAVLRGR